MKINCFSVTFWFNIFTNHNEILEVLQKSLKDEYSKFNVFNYTDNLINPIITAFNNEKRTNMSFSQINFQYNMDNVTFDDIDTFTSNTLNLFDILINNGVEILHTSLFINGEEEVSDGLKLIAEHTISNKIYNSNLVDMTLKLGKCHEEQFYKIVTILNKKQVKLPQVKDSAGRNIPIPLISWHGAYVEKEIVDASYEINDKYSFDFTSDYHTTEFHLNKMLYLLKEDFKSDIDNIIKKGKF